ncbi:MAG: hypothetical protein M1818_008198 [Claussenomyces sp. TS43310]|nr:MAG: hypothetical protein M1818_008198 [Claussenomyces sp. TS43310]
MPVQDVGKYMAQHGSLPASKGGHTSRPRTSVGHRYLDVLQSKARGVGAGHDSDRSSTASSSSLRDRDEELDLLVLGITSGTMMDDIDIALCRFTQQFPDAPLFLEIVQYDSIVMPSKIRNEVLDMLREDAAPPSMLSQMDAELGHTFANAAHIFTARHNIAIDSIDLIGSGGQLVSLTARPPKGHHRANMCLGEGAIICAKTGITTVSDFRTAEQAIGRQGAPLFTYMVGLLLHHPTRMQICITIGGITTVCFIPPDNHGGIDAMYDWDTGPGTVLLDAAFRFYGLDPEEYRDGSLEDGKVCFDVLHDVLKLNEYFKARPPKTTAREIFGDAMAYEIIHACEARGCSPADVVATLTRLTTASCTQQLLVFGPGRSVIDNADIVIDGRGMYNRQFMAQLQAEFPGASFGSFEKSGVPSNAKKSVGFAMQAMEAVLGRARPVAANADVRRPNTITGKLAPGVRWREVIERSVAFGGSRSGWEGLPEVRELIVKRNQVMVSR